MKFFRTIGAVVFPLIAAWEIIHILGLKWSQAIDALNEIGLQFIEDHFVALIVLTTAVAVTVWLYRTRNLRLVVCKCHQEVFIESDTVSIVTTSQDLRAYVDNANAMFTTCTPDPTNGSIDEQSISFNILTAGISSTQKCEKATNGAVSVTQRFSKALPQHWGMPFPRPIKRRGSVRYLNSLSIKSDHYIFNTGKYQTGALILDITFPSGEKPRKVVAELIIDHGVYDIEIKELSDVPRPGCTTYRISEKPPKDIMARYKIEWSPG